MNQTRTSSPSTSRSTRSRARTWSPTVRPARSRSSRRRRTAGSSTLPTGTWRSCGRAGRRGQGRHREHPREPRSGRGGARRQWRDLAVVVLDGRVTTRDRRDPRNRRPDPADRRRRPVTGNLVRRPGYRRPRGHGHRRAPEGVLSAAAVRCLGGEIEARFLIEAREARPWRAHGPRRRRVSTRPRSSRPGRTSCSSRRA